MKTDRTKRVAVDKVRCYKIKMLKIKFQNKIRNKEARNRMEEEILPRKMIIKGSNKMMGQILRHGCLIEGRTDGKQEKRYTRNTCRSTWSN